MVFVTDRKKRRNPPDALPHLLGSRISVVPEAFTRDDVADIFNSAAGCKVLDASQVSRYQEVLGAIQPNKPIDREGIWGVYVFLAWRKVKTWQYGTQWAWKKHFQEDFEAFVQEQGHEAGEASFLETYVYSIGGSREDCDRMIDEFLAKKQTKKFA